MTTTRYPLENLARRLGIELAQPGRRPGYQDANHDDPDRLHGREALAERLGVSLSTIARMIRHGLTFTQADEAALACGFMPHQVWPTWFDDCPTDEHLEGFFGDDPALEHLDAR